MDDTQFIEMALDTVPVKNRVVDAPTTVTFTARDITWGPGETRHIARKLAEFCIHKSTYQEDPMFVSPPKQRLVQLGEGMDESDLTQAETQVISIINYDNMPATHFDDDGNELREAKLVRINVTPDVSLMRGRGPSGPRAPWGPDMPKALDAAADAAALASERGQ